MSMRDRATLIELLESRGFELGKPQDYGWTYVHKEDGFKLEFNASGQFTLTLPDGKTQRGVMSQANDVLTIIDEAAAAL